MRWMTTSAMATTMLALAACAGTGPKAEVAAVVTDETARQAAAETADQGAGSTAALKAGADASAKEKVETEPPI